jgi:glycine cleavage system T protein
VTERQETLKRTPLYDLHVRDGGRIVPFAGYEMPVQYKLGVVGEHQAVRNAAGLFDVSHMGELTLEGPGATQLVDRIVTGDAAKLEDGRALYTCACNEGGTILDDLIVYRRGRERWLIVCNASNRDKIAAHVGALTKGVCSFEDISDATALIAFQGPKALAVAAKVGGADLASLPSFAFREATLAGVACTAARTGYTGEDGLEIFCANADAARLWDALLTAGKEEGVAPIGLGARDTLRLEARLSLYGNDIDETTNPPRGGARLDRQARQARLHRQVRAGGREGEGVVTPPRRLRGDGPGHRPPRLPAARQLRRRDRHLHQRQPWPHRRQEHRPRVRALFAGSDRDRARRRLPRPQGRGGRGQDPVLQAPRALSARCQAPSLRGSHVQRRLRSQIHEGS